MKSPSLQVVLAGLTNVRSSGNGWSARCPAHDDSHASLSIHEGAEGRVLLKCFAGCSYEDILAALGLEPSDLLPNGSGSSGYTVEQFSHDKRLPLAFLRDQGVATGDWYGRPCVDIPYRNASHEVVCTRKRIAAAATDGFRWPRGTKPSPYGLDRLAATNPTEPVLLVEGESDALTCWHHGVLAVGIPGADMWRSKWAKALHDRPVVAWQEPDHGGETFVRNLALDLPKLRVVNPPDGVKDASDLHIRYPDSFKERLAMLIESAAEIKPRAAGPRAHAGSHQGQKKTQAQLLVELAQGADLWHAPDRVGYATLAVDDHLEHHAIQSSTFRRWLVRQFYQAHGKPPASQAVQSALEVLKAQADFDGEEHPVFVRVGGIEEVIYLDLGDPKWRAVEISGTGWRIVPTASIRFRRAPGVLALPPPEHGGSINALRPFVNVATEEDFRLLVSWLVGALNPNGPYPIEVLQGEHGSAKSTTERVQCALIDPSTAPLRTPPRDERDLVIAATNGWVLGFDNVSVIPNWLSDAFCRLATGGGWATRQLYTDTTEVLFDGQRPQLLNGIEELARRDDLRDRALIISLPSLPEDCRRDERSLWREFERARPGILGALLDGVSAALANLPKTKLAAMPRMADFARWITAAEPGLGWESGSFLDAYRDNLTAAVELSAEFNAVAQAIRDLVRSKGEWAGTATDLLTELNAVVPEERRGKWSGWPQTPLAMSNALTRASPTLRRLGVTTERERRAQKRIIRIGRQP